MTNKLFWSDPYLCTCETAVVSVSGPTVTLKDTVFYAFSGGQESDVGTISGYPVIRARKAGLNIEYELSADHGLQPGYTVRVEIDWDRRYNLMRLHFAAELVLELVNRKLPGIEKIGAHIAADKARIDFAWLVSIAPYLSETSAEAQAIIDRDLEIISAFSDESTQHRFWEVPGFARVPCGGTHLRRTSEVGKIVLKRKNVGKGKERVEVYVTTNQQIA
jgi:Ser-tRNA(Ala) deacylase AlaX